MRKVFADTREGAAASSAARAMDNQRARRAGNTIVRPRPLDGTEAVPYRTI